MKKLFLPLLLLPVLLLPSAAFGDTLILKNGHRFEGSVEKEDATYVWFRLKFGVQRFRKSEIAKIVKGESVFDVYRKKRRAVKPGDAEGHYRLGLWCKSKDLKNEARKEFREALKADPDHPGARKELGYVRYEGKWITGKKYREILKEIREREGEIISGLKLGEFYRDAKALVQFKPPAGWKKEVEAGVSARFTGPELGKAPVVIEFLAAEAADSLGDLAKSIRKELKKKREDLSVLAEPADTRLLGSPAKLLSFGYTDEELAPEPIEMERREIVAVTPAGTYRLCLVCRRGYYDLLKPVFGRVAASFRKMEKPPDLTAKEQGFSLVFPDEAYKPAKTFPFLRAQGNRPIGIPSNAVLVVRASGGSVVYLYVLAGKKGDGAADTTSLETLRDSLPRIHPLGGTMQRYGEEKTVKVDGVEALTGRFKIAQGRMGNGFWFAMMKGDRYYRGLFLNWLGVMGDRYVEEDFHKILSGWKFLE